MHFPQFATVLTLCLVTLISTAVGNTWNAQKRYTASINLPCDFTTPKSDNTCDTNLRQVFKILSVDSSKVFIGSTECLYVLDQGLGNPRSTRIQLNTNDIDICEFALAQSQQDFRCKNYISYGHPVDSSSFRVCGTYSSIKPRCWLCSDNGTSVSCGEGRETAYMPKTPTQNFTVIMANDSGTDYYYAGGLQSHTSLDHVLAKVMVNVSAAVTDATVRTDHNENRIMYNPQDFVGTPIEHNQFIYFFFRERAKEYDNIGQIIYSRVARVCKNDPGGKTNPLAAKFTTFLKTRLICSVGSDFPFSFNEIQDVKQSKENPNIIYGLFTTPNVGTSSTAICRYDLRELETLFNEDFRRGQLSSTQLWQRISRDPQDTLAERTCGAPYHFTLYTHLKNYPLMKTSAANCGLGSNCANYMRTSDNALAVFEGIRGHSLAVYAERSEEFTAFIGTNDHTIYRATVRPSEVLTTEKIVTEIPSPLMTERQRNDKWPYGVSYLQVHNNAVYGTLDNCAFRFQPDGPVGSPDRILDRSPQIAYNHSVRVPEAVTTISKLFEAPAGTAMKATFSDNLRDGCKPKLFAPASSSREFLHVFCQVRDITAPLAGTITVSGLSGNVADLAVNVNIDIDETDPKEGNAVEEINLYDKEVAKYLYKLKEWLGNVTCNDSEMDTCPSYAVRDNY